MFNLVKKVMSWSLAACMTLSPVQAGYMGLDYGNAGMHIFLTNPSITNIKVASSVCPYLKEDEEKVKTFPAKAKTLEKIVNEYESESKENVLAALNGSYFGTKKLIPVGLVKQEDCEMKYIVEAKKKKPLKKPLKKPKFPDYEFRFRASFMVDKKGNPQIAYQVKMQDEQYLKCIGMLGDKYLDNLKYFNDPSKAKYFLVAGPMLVHDGKSIWEQAYKKEMFSPNYRNPYRRAAVAITRRGNLMLIATEKMTLDKLTKFLMRIEVRDAMCLDSGSSTQMVLDKVYDNFGKIKKGNYSIEDPRQIVNGILVVE